MKLVFKITITMRNLVKELETSRGVNKILINEIDRLSKELKMEVELHFDTIERHSELLHSIDYLTNTKKPF